MLHCLKRTKMKTMSKKQTILLVSVIGVAFVALLAFSLRREASLNSLQIEIRSLDGSHFITEQEVTELMRGEENVLSLPVSKWDMSELERRIETNPFVRDAQVYRDVKGNVLVKVDQRKPIARLYHTQERDKYIDEMGNLLPTTADYTARVPVVEVEGLKWNERLDETLYGQELLNFLKYVEQDKFWRAQLAHIVVRKDGELEIIPQVTRQRVIFGKPADYEKKLDKLMLFYKQILPVKGWNTYTTVNLKFNDQIICE